MPALNQKSKKKNSKNPEFGFTQSKKFCREFSPDFFQNPKNPVLTHELLTCDAPFRNQPRYP